MFWSWYAVYANSNMKAVGSSTHMNEHPSYVLDELYGNECKTINVYSSVHNYNIYALWYDEKWP